jgi:hypothetical protein
MTGELTNNPLLLDGKMTQGSVSEETKKYLMPRRRDFI